MTRNGKRSDPARPKAGVGSQAKAQEGGSTALNQPTGEEQPSLASLKIRFVGRRRRVPWRSQGVTALGSSPC
jgi:hypothetical protein